MTKDSGSARSDSRAMYLGEDPEAANYDPEKKIMRASMNGSRGPKMEWTKRDWIPTNANLVYYPLPYDDIPGVESSTGWINDSPQDDQFGRIVKTMSDRMAKGDTAINMTATPLIANAYLYSGDEKYVRWVKDYVGGWVERTKANGGITPDNVGLSGRVGEYTNGNWWGGYYGWRWPRGGMDVVLAAYTASKVAVLLTGDRDWFELPRSQLRVMQSKARSGRTGREIPLRYDNTRGWHHYMPEPPYSAVNLWAVTQEAQDWTRWSKSPTRAADLKATRTSNGHFSFAGGTKTCRSGLFEATCGSLSPRCTTSGTSAAIRRRGTTRSGCRWSRCRRTTWGG